ncbi:MAG: Do family serine endopeptidase [Hydrogenothermaceae bacterium]
MRKFVLPLLAILTIAYIGFAQFSAKFGKSFVMNNNPSLTYPNLEAEEKERIALIEKVSNGVATIYTTHEVKIQNPFFDMPFGDFFGIPNQPEFKQKRQGLGSGFIVAIDYDKKMVYLLTNNHVVENAKNVQVLFKNRVTVEGKVIGGDKLSDIAVVGVPFKKGIEKFAAENMLKLGDSDTLKVGSTVIAIGSPLGLTDTITTGIVSAKNRQIEDRPGEGFIQTDAAINPGNSGGPLVNIRGEVVGINTAIIQGAQGLGFAVPVNQAKWVMEQILQYGKVKRSKIGVIVQPVTPELAEHFGINYGAIVSNVQPGGPADKAGIKAGDVIVEVNGKKITDISELQNQIMKNPPGTEVSVKVLRDGKTLEFNIKTVALDEETSESTEEKQTQDESSLGLIVKDLTPQIIQKYGLPKVDYGVLIYGIKSGSNAEDAGLKAGDIILSVNKKPVRNSAEFWKEIKQAIKSGSDSVLLYIQRQDIKTYISLPLK